MCFSAGVNFVGSAVLTGVGIATLTRVKHRRELLFASLPTLFAVHQFIEGFVWLGLDGILSPAVAHNMCAWHTVKFPSAPAPSSLADPSNAG
jgi:uncharacterized membrane protein